MLKKKTDRRWKISLWCSTWKALGLARTQLRSSRLLLFPWETLRVKASTGCCVCFNIINTPSSCLLPCFHDQNALTYLDTTGSFCQQCQSTGEPPWCMGWRWGKSLVWPFHSQFKGYCCTIRSKMAAWCGVERIWVQMKTQQESFRTFSGETKIDFRFVLMKTTWYCNL